MRWVDFALRGVLCLMLFAGLPAEAQMPDMSDSEKAAAAKRHHLSKGGFRNPPNSPRRNESARVRWSFFGNIIRRNLTAAPPDIPDMHVVPAAEARRALATAGNTDTLTWIGHAGFLVRLGGVNILTDPIWSKRASPLRFAGPKRLTPPGLPMEALPPIDVVVVSHAHYDHLDVATLARLPDRENITAIAPLGLGKYFKGYKRVYEVDWYDTVELENGFKLTAYPAVHWSNRTPFDRNRTLWMSYGFSAGGRSVYHTGDTDVHPTLFGEIGAHMARTHGGCDIGLMSVGAYEPRAIMSGSHTDPEGGAQMGRDIGCKTMVPMHWGTFILSFEPFDAPRARFAAAAGDAARVFRIGETQAISAMLE